MATATRRATEKIVRSMGAFRAVQTLSQVGVTVHYGNATYSDVTDFTFSEPLVVGGSDGAVEIGLQNLAINFDCENGTANAEWG